MTEAAPSRLNLYVAISNFVFLVLVLLIPAMGEAQVSGSLPGGPLLQEGQFATISGEVFHPGRYPIKKGERLSSLIERAGGYRDEAYLPGAIFTRASLREAQQESLKVLALRMERELLSPDAARMPNSLTADEIRVHQVELARKEKLVKTISKLKAKGRMVIRLSHMRLLKNSEFDVELKEGDHLHIPQRSNFVQVNGAVRSPGPFLFTPGYGYKNYLTLAGGHTDLADAKNAFLIKVDGSAHKLVRPFVGWNAAQTRWEFTRLVQREIAIDPGDSIVIPEETDRFPWMKKISDRNELLMHLTVTAGFFVKLF